jgi:hypothetical protein
MKKILIIVFVVYQFALVFSQEKDWKTKRIVFVPGNDLAK